MVVELLSPSGIFFKRGTSKIFCKIGLQNCKATASWIGMIAKFLSQIIKANVFGVFTTLSPKENCRNFSKRLALKLKNVRLWAGETYC